VTAVICPPTVRLAIEADGPELFAFVIQAHEEFLVRKNNERVAATIERAVTTRRNPVFGIIKRQQGIEAAIGLSFSEPWFSDAPLLSNFIFHVHPEHRRTSHAADLVDFGAWFAATIGMPFLLNEWSNGQSGRAKLFERKGHRIGQMFAVAAEAA
jgi:hypothetical protein